MIKEEKILTQAMSRDSHFKVPEGYFDQLAEQVMAKLPKQEPRIISIAESSWWHRLPLRKIAASVAVACLLGGGTLVVLHQQSAHTHMVASSAALVHAAGSTTLKQASSEDATFNEMANYTMMDNETIYASLVTENKE